MQPKRIQITPEHVPVPAVAHARPAGAAPGTSPAADLQQLILAHYADAASNRQIPLPARLAIMFSMSAVLWAGIALVVHRAIG